MWVRVKIERESWVFISASGPSSEKCAEEIEGCRNKLNACVGSFYRNGSVVVLWDLTVSVINMIEGRVVSGEMKVVND